MLRFCVAFLCAPAILFAAAAQADDKAGCKPDVTGRATVRAVADGRTVILTDGREMRLSGLEIPRTSGDPARKALEQLVLGREITLLRMDPEADRYGRLVGGIAAAESGAPVQMILLAQGHALVSADIADRNCRAAFLSAEKQARAAGLGLWRIPYGIAKKAEDAAGILGFRGQFAVIEGKVVSVRESGGTIYVNFGGRWSEDFTVTALKRNERSFRAAGLELKKLAGQRVRVRGTVEARGGPWIEAVHPGQIEIAGQP